MKSTLIIISGLIMASCTFMSAQTTELESKLRTQNNDTTVGWKRGGIINIGLSQTSLTNWSAGGQNSVSINGLLNLFAHKKTKKALWENYLDLGYGLLKQGNSSNWRKTDDKLDFTCKYGYQTSNKWYIAGLLNFKTQMTQGFNFVNDTVQTKISNFLAPGYLIGALGIEYKTNGFSVFIAPVTAKVTIVADQSIADAGGFGVEKAKFDALGNITERGRNIRQEFGGYVKIMYKKEIMKNIGFQTRAEFFSNYLNNPQNTDINWETLLNMNVNNFVSVSIATTLIYDDDIDINVLNDKGQIIAKGPRTQFKQVLTAGITYKF